MQRRTFCSLLGGTFAAAALASKSGVARAAAAAFNRLGQTYAEFCATPEMQRLFYALRGGAVAPERLDPASWKEPGWGLPADPPMPSGWWNGVPLEAPVAGLAGSGPFRPTWESLDQYECPEWYRDAKFGIWNHWSPQCVAEDGDWYARNAYVDDQPQHRYHLEHYGHPSKFGYKDLCAQWTLLNWQPEQLMDLYSSAGARLFIALANHHDGFDAWNSRHQPWNAQNVGPRRDVIGTWAKAARDRGMKFGVTVHQARNWWWFQVAHGADRTGPLAGVPYDGRLTLSDGKGQWWEGLDPQLLYGPKHPADALPDASYVKNFYDRTRDLIDQHDPDLLYFDDSLLPLGWAGMAIGAYFYNHRLARHGGGSTPFSTSRTCRRTCARRWSPTSSEGSAAKSCPMRGSRKPASASGIIGAGCSTSRASMAAICIPRMRSTGWPTPSARTAPSSSTFRASPTGRSTPRSSAFSKASARG